MKKLCIPLLAFGLLTFCATISTAGPALRFEIYADSTLAGQPGFLLNIDEPGVPTETLFLYEDAGRVRVLALREDFSPDWEFYAPNTYLAPAVGEAAGTTWAFIPNDFDGLLTATLERFGNRTVPAGTFFTALCINRPVSAPGVDLEAIFFAADVGLITEFYFGEGEHLRLLNYSLMGGSGYFPLAVGNWWDYEVYFEPGPVLPPALNLLHANVPNPFNPLTDISFETGAAGQVRLRVHDAAGRLIRTLVDEHRAAGVHVVTWDGRDAVGQPVAAGVYFYRFEAGRSHQSRAMTLVK